MLAGGVFVCAICVYTSHMQRSVNVWAGIAQKFLLRNFDYLNYNKKNNKIVR